MIKYANTAIILSVAPFLLAGQVNATTIFYGDEYGAGAVDTDAFGTISDSGFDPIGSINFVQPIFEGFIAIKVNNEWLTLADAVSSQGGEASEVFADPSTVQSTFSIGSLMFTLTQAMVPEAATSEGLVKLLDLGYSLSQSINIINSGSTDEQVELRRYNRGYVRQEVDEETVLGTLESLGSFYWWSINKDEVDTEFRLLGNSEMLLRSAIFSDLSLPELQLPEWDFTADEIEFAQSFTLTLQPSTSQNVNFGYAMVARLETDDGAPAPGATEDNPLLDDAVPGNDSFDFQIDLSQLTEGQTIWIDPEVATGYIYTVTGAEFASVTMPSLSTVPDGDGRYTLTADGLSTTILSGQTHVFATPVSTFTITGIDPLLALDPADPAAFVTGVALTKFGGAIATISQTPIVTDVQTPAPVPLPASVPMLLAGMLALAALGARRARS